MALHLIANRRKVLPEPNACVERHAWEKKWIGCRRLSSSWKFLVDLLYSQMSTDTLGLSGNSSELMHDFRSYELDVIDALLESVCSSHVDAPVGRRLADPSLLSSMWQKAIRRGHEGLASEAAIALWEIDREYVWRRIRSIAVEDVSVGNLGLVAQVIAVSSKAALLRRVGESRVLVHLTRMLARSPKCRTGCELLVWRANSAYDGSGNDEASTRGLLEAGTDASDWARVVDAWLLTESHSVRRSGHWKQVSKACPEKRRKFLEAIGASEASSYVAMKGGRTDRLNVMVPIVDQLKALSAMTSTDAGLQCMRPESINGYPAFAFCLYSKPGREALRMILRSTGWGHRLARMGVSNLVGALGSLVFYVEGGLCDASLRVAHAPKIQWISRASQLGELGVPAEAIDELLEDARRDLPLINRYRRLIRLSGQED